MYIIINIIIKGDDILSFDFIKDKHMKIHFIGIGGISMSGLVAVLLNNGYRVSGSDAKESKITESLKRKRCFYLHRT